MRKSFLLAVLILSALISLGQQLRDVVYLKNGGLIYGIIIEIIPESTIKIKTADGSIFVYKIDEIEKIIKEDTKKSSKKDSLPANEIAKGYKGFFSVYKGIGSLDFIGLSTSHGYQKSPYLYFGGGVGIISLDNNNPFLMPFFKTRWNLSKTNFTPFVDIKLGYAMSRNGGVNINPSFGFRLGGISAAFNASLGYVYGEGEYPMMDEYKKVNPISLFYFGLGFEI